MSVPASAAPVQISQSGNLYSPTVGVDNTAPDLKADLTGDMQADLPGLWFGTWSTSAVYGAQIRVNGSLGSVIGQASFDDGSFRAFAGTGSNLGYASVYGTPNSDVRGFFEISFMDANINGGNATQGFVEIKVSNTSQKQHTIELIRLVFDDANTNYSGSLTPGGNLPEFGDVTPPPTGGGTPTASDSNQTLKTSLTNKIKKLKKKLKKTKNKKLKKKIKKLKKKLAAL